MSLLIDLYATEDSIRDLVNTVLNGDIKEKILVEVAFHGRTPSDVLEQLSKSESARVRAAVAMHRKVPVWVMYNLAYDSDYKVRANVVYSPYTPEKLLYEIVNNEEEDLLVRIEVAYNYYAPPELLETAWRLIQQHMDSANESIRYELSCAIRGLAGNPNTPPHILPEIAKVDEFYADELILQHESVSVDALKILADSQHSKIRALAQRQLDKLGLLA